MLLSEATVDQLEVGVTRVRSLSTKGFGTIVAVWREDKREDRYDSVDIRWDSGKLSQGLFLSVGEYVEIVNGSAEHVGSEGT